MNDAAPQKKKVELSQEQKDRVKRMVEVLLANAAILNEMPKGRVVINFAGSHIACEFTKFLEVST